MEHLDDAPNGGGPSSMTATTGSSSHQAAAVAGGQARGLESKRPPRTRTSAAFIAFGTGALVLLLLLIFILASLAGAPTRGG